MNRERADFAFANFDCQDKRLGRRDVAQINKLIVRCAEELVFFVIITHGFLGLFG